MIDLSSEIKFLKGVGPKRAELLSKELEIKTINDLLYYFPYRYVNKSKFHSISEISLSLPFVQIKGKIVRIETQGDKHNQRLRAIFTDGIDFIDLVWFKGVKWIKDSIKLNTEYIIFGKPSEFAGKFTIAHPEIEEVAKQNEQIQSPFLPMYNTTEKLKNHLISSKTIYKLILSLFQLLESFQLKETLPDDILVQKNFLSLYDALFNIHLPQSEDLLKDALYRLKFEELFFLQINLLQSKFNRKESINGHVFSTVGFNLNTFYKNYLPFQLTDAQKKVIKEIRKDTGSGKQMNRLLQGDVGSGKTLVALMTILIAIDNGFQASIMAPTEILANQHFVSITKLLDDMKIRVELLTGSVKKSKRNDIFEGLLNGSINILIGTHALIEETVQFKNLGLVVIDEQHRFGVAQRAKLWKKNENPPHILVMTATPIPRTLAMTFYGDLDVSVIDELPPGRKPVKTFWYYEKFRSLVYEQVKKQLSAGLQMYVVYPLIKESEVMDYQFLEDGFQKIVSSFPEFNVVKVHGQQKSDERNEAMQSFIQGKSQILVATTVIEVGVDVPKASVMIIESAERFGLSQLHQLRGRVGRGANQSFCYLITSYKISDDASNRLKTMVRTNDGFVIAEEDLRMRGPGDMEGIQQSGFAFDLKLSNLAKDGGILQEARELAEEILKNDPTLISEKNYLIKSQLENMNKQQITWSIIS